MRNRAKCKLCESIIESLDRNDCVTCSCGAISIEGGQEMLRCRANEWENFLRVDDNDNIIIPKFVETDPEAKIDIQHSELTQNYRMDKEEALEMLKEMAKRLNSLPPEALFAPINHADFCSLLLLLWEILRAKD